MIIQSTHTESLLALQLLSGNESAFAALYQRYYQAVYHTAITIIKDTAAAEDLVQEVFLALWEKRASLGRVENLAGWLFVTCSNKALNMLRRRLRQRLHPGPEAVLADIPYVPDTTELIEAQLRLLRTAIDTLPPQRKKIFELVKLQGYSYEQAAAELGLSKNTVKSQMSSALESLKTWILAQPGDAAVLAGLLICLYAAGW